MNIWQSPVEDNMEGAKIKKTSFQTESFGRHQDYDIVCNMIIFKRLVVQEVYNKKGGDFDVDYHRR